MYVYVLIGANGYMKCELSREKKLVSTNILTFARNPRVGKSFNSAMCTHGTYATYDVNQ